MICICGNNTVKVGNSSVGSYSAKYYAKYYCMNCGNSWKISNNNKCLCGSTNSFGWNGIQFECAYCKRIIVPTLSNAEVYLDNIYCGVCKTKKIAVMVSNVAFKCLTCSTLQVGEGSITYVFIKDGNNIRLC